MKLIADSGSTKTDWRLIDREGNIHQAKSDGINPNYVKKESIIEIVKSGLGDWADHPIEEIFFYGAGCSSATNKSIVSDSLSVVYPDAQIEVQHDLLAAARSLCGRDQGIACILGTGANSGLYDGQNIIENEASLGYMIGDEGGGTYLGKQFLIAHLRGKLPDQISANFQSRFKMTNAEVIEQIYKSEKPQQFLSQFAKFIFQNIKEPALYRLVYEAFTAFVEINIKSYTHFERVPVHFTGSVAFYFGNILRQVGADQGITIKHIVESPIAGLTLYHQDNP